MKKNAQLPQIINPENPLWMLEEIKDDKGKQDLDKLYKMKKPDPLKIIYFGTPQFSAYILDRLIESAQNPQAFRLHIGGVNVNQLKFEIQTVVTSPDRPMGRLKEPRSSAVSQVASKHNIPTLKPEKLDRDFIPAHLSLLASDLFIVASYGKIIPQALLDIPRLGAINVHGSTLPKYRGASPIQAAILNGEKETGVTIMLMDAKMDHGPILSTKKLSISEQDTFDSLSIKMSQESVPLLLQTITDFVSGKIKPKPQDHTQVTFCKLLSKEDGFFAIDHSPSPEILDRMIRAYYPWPTAWTKWNGKIVKLLPKQLVQIEGKKPVKLADFLRGYPGFPIKSF